MWFLDAFNRQFGASNEAVKIVKSPGRVNLIGEHIDYQGGIVLPFAIDQHTLLMARIGFYDRIRIHSMNFPEQLDSHRTALPDYEGKLGWINFVVGALRQFNISSGVDIMVVGNLPTGSGLSSSASLLVGLVFLLDLLFDCQKSPSELLAIALRVEQHYMKVDCGIMDHYAIFYGKSGHATAINCTTKSVSWLQMPLGDKLMVIVQSHKKRELRHSEYNNRVSEANFVKTFIQEHFQTVPCQLSKPQFDDAIKMLDARHQKRLRHAWTEQQRVHRVMQSVELAEWETVGKLLYESHYSLRNDFEVTCPELDFIVDTAQNIPGVLGGRMTGAGFGGCLIFLLEPSALTVFIEHVSRQFYLTFGVTPDFLVTRPANGVHQLVLE